MHLDSLSFIALFSYFIGSLPLSLLFSDQRRGKGLIRTLVINLLQGMLVVALAFLLIGTGMAMAIAGFFLFIGQRFSFWHGFSAEGSLVFMASGFWLLLSPSPLLMAMALALGLSLLFSFLFRKAVALSIIAVSLSFPFLVWWETGYDLFLLLAALSSLFLIYDVSPLLLKKGMTIRQLVLSGELPPGRKKRFLRRIRFILIALLLLSSLFFIGNRYLFRGFGLQVDFIRHGNPELKYIALTFDDGPDPEYTPAILDILAEYQIPATFFLVGDHVQQHPELARRLVEEGHEIGNHTQHHRNLYRLPAELIVEEVVRAEESIREAVGQEVNLFRPPRGLYDDNLLEILQERGYTLVLWSLSSQDWMEISPRSIQQRILRNIKGGDILLFHDSGSIIARHGGNRYNTIQALPGLLEELTERGYSLVTITELMIIDQLSRKRGEGEQ